MALVVVNLTDTFDEWRIKTNLVASGPFEGSSIASTVTGTTQSPGNNTTLLATTAFVTAAIQLEDTLAEMNDTTFSSLANLDVIQYNSSSSVWENKTLAAAGIPTLVFTIAMDVDLG